MPKSKKSTADRIRDYQDKLKKLRQELNGELLDVVHASKFGDPGVLKSYLKVLDKYDIEPDELDKLLKSRSDNSKVGATKVERQTDPWEMPDGQKVL
jgi:hypothetical protein